MKRYAILLDTTYCTGCNTCLYKCVQENRIHAPAARGLTRTIVHIKDEGLYHHRCMHCETPTCVGVCPAQPKALIKTEYGPVLHDPRNCIGCGECADTCPFGAPLFDEVTQRPIKCSMCAHRIGAGLKPACVEVCPTNSFVFGEYAEVVNEAKARAAKNKLHLYGLEENGGTNLIVLTREKPEAIGYPKVGGKPVTAGFNLPGSPGLPLIAGLAVAGLNKLGERKARVAAEEGGK